MDNLLRQLKPYVDNEEAYGCLHADFADLIEVFQWLEGQLQALDARILSADELETFLIEIDVRFVDHAGFHIRSLKKEINRMLKKFPNEDV